MEDRSDNAQGDAAPDVPRPSPDGPGEQRWATPGVLSVGAASFFSDSGHELATGLLPTFVTSTLHAGPGALAAIDGVADALTGLSKLAGGPLAADPARRGRLASGGYVLTALATAAIGFATAVWQVAILRAVAWTSRGIRSPARDALLTDLAPQRAYGRAFGVERAGDNLGAIVGPLLGAALVGVVGVRHAIWFSVVPGMLAAVAITVAAREARRTLTAPAARRTFALHLRELRGAGMARALAPVAAFELGNVATTLLILRATGLLHDGGASTTRAASVAILLYAAHNAAASAAALVGGRVVDRTGGRPVLAAAASAYVLAYLTLAGGPESWVTLGAAFVVAGAGIGLAETAQSTLVATEAPPALRAQAFGLLGLVQSFGDLGSTLVAGLLWSAVSPQVAFCYLAAWMLVAAAGALGGHRRPAPASTPVEHL